MKNYITTSANIKRDSYVWNMFGSFVVAFQSVIILIFLTRTVGLEQSGIFTISYASANLFMNIGKYGIRNFQVSDTKGEFSFGEYLFARKVTFFVGVCVSIIYVLITSKVSSYSFEKSMIIIVMCIYKMSDAIEDVYGGHYQSLGRLDVSAKIMTIRVIISINVFIALVVITRNQLFSLIITTIITYGVLFVFIKKSKVFIESKEYNVRKGKWWHLLKLCFPLFIGMFLSFYIGNAPKYAIDAQLSDQVQACYGFIAMPVFVVGLLNNFIFNPTIYKLSILWQELKYKEFFLKVWKQIFIIIGIAFVCVLGAYVLGIPILSFMYNTNLSPYKIELLILLVGGGFYAMTGFFSTLITIIRFQDKIAIVYILAAIIALIVSNPIVHNLGILGASLLYLGLMLFLSICFGVIFIVGVRGRKKNV